MTACPFCPPNPASVCHEDELVVAFWDSFPVSPGHCLVVPRRHVADWWQATPEERAALTEATVSVRALIEQRFRPEGYNIGVNAGGAAGQTIFHLHLHVIPRYPGDVPDPRGGVRWVIPSKANYLAGGPNLARRGPSPSVQDQESRSPHPRPLIRGGLDPLLPHLAAAVSSASCADIAVAFLLSSGWSRMRAPLEDLLQRGGRLRLLTGDYMGVTEPDALREVLRLQGAWPFEARVFETRNQAFHPKCYLFQNEDGTGIAFVGSSNLSGTALGSGIEWNYRISTLRDPAGVAEVRTAFDDLFRNPETRDLTLEWVAHYQFRREAAALPGSLIVSGLDGVPQGGLPRAPLGEDPAPALTGKDDRLPAIPQPNPVQLEALEALDATREAGNRSGLVVLATGLGKTYLAAFDSRPFRRVLFVAHREEILNQARRTFEKARPGISSGLYAGEEKSGDADLVFASVATLGRRNHLLRFAPEHFDYIVIDEFHHAAARTYRNLLDHFNPKFLLGLTATPERMDGGNLLALCDENLVYRCDLPAAIERDLLCPFHYLGVPDEVEYENIPWRSNRFDEEALTEALATRSRAQNALDQLRAHGGEKALAFCVSVRHATFMRDFFREQGLRAAAVHSGPGSDGRRESLEALARNDLDVVCAVDMFNEGVDLPAVDTVLMLRPTESKVVWFQQLGRGLRKSPGKPYLAVIDYIGNHRIFLRKTQFLLGLPTGHGPIAHALRLLEQGRGAELGLPPGCEITYGLGAIEILKRLLPASVDTLPQFYAAFKEEHGVRPRAVEAMHEGHAPGKAGGRFWVDFVSAMGDLPSGDQLLTSPMGDFLRMLERTSMVKSYKMVLLEAMMEEGAFPGEIALPDLARAFARVAGRSAHLQADVSTGIDDLGALQRLLVKMPIKYLTTGDSSRFFDFTGSLFRARIPGPTELLPIFVELTREIVEWRLAQYLDRASKKGA